LPEAVAEDGSRRGIDVDQDNAGRGFF